MMEEQTTDLKKSELGLTKPQMIHFLEQFSPSDKRPDLIYDLQTGKCVYLGPALKRITGRNCNEVFSKCLGFVKTMIHPTDYLLFISSLIEFVMKEKKPVNGDLTGLVESFAFRIKNQKNCWVKVTFHALMIVPDMLVGIIRKITPPEGNPSPLNQISSREMEVLKLISLGDSAKIIGEKLSISMNTVITHRKHLKQKLQAKNTAELIKEAVKARII